MAGRSLAGPLSVSCNGVVLCGTERNALTIIHGLYCSCFSSPIQVIKDENVLRRMLENKGNVSADLHQRVKASILFFFHCSSQMVHGAIKIDDQLCRGTDLEYEYLTQAEPREKAREKIETLPPVSCHHCLLPSHRTGHFPFRTARTTRRVRVSNRTAPLSSTSATKVNDRRRRPGYRYRAPTTTIPAHHGTPPPSWRRCRPR